MLTHFSITQQGRRHIEGNIPCQDFSASKRIRSDKAGCEVVIAAVADGVGSCSFSQYGSEAAVCGFVEQIESAVLAGLELTDENILKLLRSAFDCALSRIETDAEKRELPFLEFDTTLTGLLYDGHNLWFGHIGDDGVVALYTDGTYEMITQRHKGAEAHSVFPLRERSLWQFGKAKQDVAACVLMTDGVLDHCVDSEAMHSRVYFPFLEPALTDASPTDEDAESKRKDWDEYLSGHGDYSRNFRDDVTDDISFVVVQNPEALKLIPEIGFDYDKWDADTARRKKELEEALYADYYAYKAGTYKAPAKAPAKPSEKQNVKPSAKPQVKTSAESSDDDDLPINDFMPKGYVSKQHSADNADKYTFFLSPQALDKLAKNLFFGNEKSSSEQNSRMQDDKNEPDDTENPKNRLS